MGNGLKHRIQWMACGLFLLAVLGCDVVSSDDHRQVQRELREAREEVARLENRLAEQQQSVRVLQSQLVELRGLDEAQRLDQLVVPERIELASRSGGYDRDGKPGDDGILLFVRPLDRDGHVIKAAGSLEVTIYDLNLPPERNLIARYNFPPDALSELWYGRLMTNHYTVRCPWPEGYTPEHNELTVRVVFTELLTGRSMSVQEVFTITLPPDAP